MTCNCLNLRQINHFNELVKIDSSNTTHKTEVQRSKVQLCKINAVEDASSGNGQDCIELLKLQQGVQIEVVAIEQVLEYQHIEVIIATKILEHLQVHIVQLPEVVEVLLLEVEIVQLLGVEGTSLLHGVSRFRQ